MIGDYIHDTQAGRQAVASPSSLIRMTLGHPPVQTFE